MHRRMIMTAAMLALLPGTALAQARMCMPPARPGIPRPDLPSAREPARVVPIGGYTLALTWSPGYCRANRHLPDSRFRCASGNRFGFTLHGLWPDGAGRDWPQYCAAAEIVPSAVIRETMCTTPSAQLIQHEWAKHGTCTGMTPAAYFAEGRRLFSALRYPEMTSLSRRPLTVGGFKTELAAVNPGLPRSAIRVTTAGRGWLDEVLICLDTRRRYAACRPGNSGAPDTARLQIWRGE